MYPEKIKQLKEAFIAAFSPRFTTRFPAEPCIVPKKFRGKPEINPKTCNGCGQCVNVCPTRALKMIDNEKSAVPTRTITVRYDACIFCGHCHDNCITENGINLTNEWDLAGFDREEMVRTYDFELKFCDKCGAVAGTKKLFVWLNEKFSSQAASTQPRPAADSGMQQNETQENQQPQKAQPDKNAVKILCPQCKCELNITV